MEMDGKVVVVTGASMGIGEAIAKVFADAGASVVLLSRDASRAEAARHRVGHTERTLAMACDVRNREDIDRALALTLHHFDRVDVWINNAGVGIRDSVADMDAGVLPRIVRNQLLRHHRLHAGGGAGDARRKQAAGRSSTYRALPDTFRCRSWPFTPPASLP